MVDWLTVQWNLTSTELDALVKAASYGHWGETNLRLTPQGELIRETKRPERIESSCSSIGISLGVGETNTAIRIDGNPQKYLFGQNVFGSLGPRELLERLMVPLRLFLGAEIQLPPDFAISLLRIDLTESIWLDDEHQVSQFLDYINLVARKRKSMNAKDGMTVYLGKHSSEWSTKFYSKFHEVKNEPQEGIDPESLRGLLRVEHVLRRKHIQREMYSFRQMCNAEFREKVYVKMFEKISIPEKQMETKYTHENLPSKLRPLWREWISGTNLKPDGGFWSSRPTAYRQRSAMLKHGIDIFGPVCLDGMVERENIVPFALAQLRKREAWARTVRKAA